MIWLGRFSLLAWGNDLSRPSDNCLKCLYPIPSTLTSFQMNGLNPSQQAKLRQIIHEHLGSNDVYSKIRSFVRDFLESEEGLDLDEDKLLSVLHEKVGIAFTFLSSWLRLIVLFAKRVIEELLASLGRDYSTSQSGYVNRPAPTRGGRYLHVRLCPGHAFVDNSFFELSAKNKGTIVFHVFLFGQRFASKPVPASVDPDVNESFLFEILQPTDQDSLVKVGQLIRVVL
jgi:hypothetical protein